MIRCIYSPFTEIYFHLAAEEYLLKQGNEDIFMLWQDTPSVVIGKHQRLRSEVDQETTGQSLLMKTGVILPNIHADFEK